MVEKAKLVTSYENVKFICWNNVTFQLGVLSGKRCAQAYDDVTHIIIGMPTNFSHGKSTKREGGNTGRQDAAVPQCITISNCL